MSQILLIFNLIFSFHSIPSDNRRDMVINIAKLKDTGHDIYIAVCRKSDNFPANPDAVKTMMINPSGKDFVNVSFPDIPYGKYAIMIYQDLNGNKKLDKGFLGIPKEPFAFSNNVHPMFGPPSWKDCEIEYNSVSYRFQINGCIKL